MKIAYRRIQLLLLGFSFFAFNSLYAQNQHPQRVLDVNNMRDGEDVEYCITHKLLHELQQQPGFTQQYLLDQQKMKDKELEMQSLPVRRGVVYKIPVVFHILHNGGVENITNEQVMDAFNILNRDFRLLNNDAVSVHNDFRATNPAATCTPGDAEIEFVMATKAPNGTCFNGITRTLSSATSNGANGTTQVTAIRNGNDVYRGEWPGHKYLNIFIVADAGGAAGYTRQPSDWTGGRAMENGIWILSNYVGSIGSGIEMRSRALTHEVGHWLNLAHTWGNTNNPGVACGDDFVADTPETRGVTSCNLNEDFCGPRANVENYMDYSYCSKMFSHGQVARMRAALQSTVGGRNNVCSASNLAAVGADGNASLCKADFTIERQSYCPNVPVQFNDNSYNNATSWSWSFPGGNPSTSTEQNPVVTYAAPGEYNVTLVVSNGTTTLTETKTAFAKIANIGYPLPYYEGFESYSTIGDMNSIAIYNSNPASAEFELATDAGSTGTKSLKLNNFSQTGSNIDEFTSPNINLSGISSSGVTLSFRYAYRKKVSSNNESLKVYATKNCGETWDLRRTISNNTLSSQTSSTSYVPGSSDFVTIHVTNITSQFWNSNFRFKFRFEGSGGNNLYIDDINLYKGEPSDDLVLGVEKGEQFKDVRLYPNPSEGEVNIAFDIAASQTVEMKITDVLGKTIKTNHVNANAGSNLVVVDTENFASGVYLVNLGGKVMQFVVK